MRELRIEAAHIELAAFSSAPISEFNPQEPVIIALHGWLDNALSLTPLLTELESQSRQEQITQQWLALDLPGHGHSEHRPVGVYYYFSEWAMDIAKLIHEQGWQNVVLVGHSMGGFIAQLVAVVIPDLIKSVFLIEALGLLTYAEDETALKLREAFLSRRALEDKSAPQYDDAERLVNARAAHNSIAAVLIKPVVMRNLACKDGVWQWRIDPRLRLGSPFRYSIGQVNDLMASIQCPLALIRGTSGFKDLDKALERWGERVSVLWVEGGHHVHLEQPKQVAEHLNAFLGRPI
ncbi:MAG: putative hydrolases or acyltransferases (alpha/beta hydrolase superfamily) [Idiomarinaceae bacterium HL-53]|nr:MAG: putative hydrolases or acyltransferases (alpha/beta hydrolase superfamily) [Idiomarinaceae bacterium HL-53]CUS48591.1 Pimeloyl-ACP methyl ester carboxylesterase [Idiomarinaceae bacterium HL-53]